MKPRIAKYLRKADLSKELHLEFYNNWTWVRDLCAINREEITEASKYPVFPNDAPAKGPLGKNTVESILLNANSLAERIDDACQGQRGREQALGL